jgi:uncharacterized protein (UPF0548 family)
MIFLREPSDEEVRRFIAAQGGRPLSYGEVGRTRGGTPPDGYPINQGRRSLGEGREAFAAAAEALDAWEMYSLEWTKLCWPETPPREGAVVAVLARTFGLWTLNAVRVVYDFEETDGRVRRRGFAIGTLPGHVERGEERFAVGWDRETDEVWFELFAFAKARSRLARLGGPVVRLVQRRFAAESLGAMRRAVARRAAT